MGINTILLNTNYDANRAADYVRRLIGLKVAGVALMTAELDPSLIQELIRKNISVISQNFGRVSEHMSNVVIDYADGCRRSRASSGFARAHAYSSRGWSKQAQRDQCST